MMLLKNYCKLNKRDSLVENDLKKLKTFDSSYFFGKNHFEEDGTQVYLVYQPINRYYKVIEFPHGNLMDYLLKVLNHLMEVVYNNQKIHTLMEK